MNLVKPRDDGLGQHMRKAACHSGSVDSLILCRFRGKGLHHHGGDVCLMFALCVWSVVETRPHPVRACSNDSVDQVASANINSCK